MERIAVVAGGSAAPGLGALARSVGGAAAARGAEAVAVAGGLGGILSGAPVPLPAGAPSPDLAPAPFPDLRKPDGAAALAAGFAEAGVTAVVVAEGEGAAAGAAALGKAGLPVAFVPATVLDDVRGTDACLGMDTFVNGVMRLVAAESGAGAPLVVELPGMLTSHGALLAAVGAGARGAVLVERPFPWDRWLAAVAGATEPPVLFCSEGAGSAKEAVARMAQAWTGAPARVIPASALDRNGPPTLFDRLLALRFGESAVEALLGGAAGRMIAFRAGLTTPVPLEGIAGRRRQVPPEVFETAARAGVIFE